MRHPILTVISSLLVVGLLSVPAELVAQTEAKPQPAPAASGAIINLNTATVDQLESLPGVGPATAKRILEYRQKSGGFKKIEELMNVRGIGEKAFLRLKPRVTVTTPKPNSL